MGLCHIALLLVAAACLGCVLSHPGRPPMLDPSKARELFHMVEANSSEVNGRLTEAEVDEIFEDFDVNESRVYQRWVSLGLGDKISGGYLFQRLDTDQDGTLSKSPDLDRVFHYFDINGDGEVTEVEFVVIWTTMSS